ncbi:MAG: polysaccharide biosynthesis protein [Frankiales bacterium]|nr:polysaccharide biosynthesis protein [Frankiales bacterium]
MTDVAPTVARRGWAPAGTFAVGQGLVVLGISTYVFLALAGRTLDAVGFAQVSVVYTAVNVLGGGLFYPVEQQLGRLTAAQVARGEGSGRLLGAAALVVAVLLVVTLGFVGLSSPAWTGRLLAGDGRMVAALGAGLCSYAVVYFIRGALAGAGRFRAYGAQLGLEGVLRVIGAGLLVVTGADSALAFAALIAVCPLVAAACVAGQARGLLTAGPSTGVRPVASSLGLLLVGGVAAQTLANAGPLLVALLATSSERERVGIFLAAVVLARVPVFLFAAVQAVLIPDVAGAAAAGRWVDVRSSVRSLVLLVGGLGAFSAAAAAVLGPAVVRLVFGDDFAIGRVDLVLLALSGCVFLLAQVCAQALVALGRLEDALGGWLAGLAGLAASASVVGDLELRVELGLLLGSLVAAVVHGRLLSGTIGRLSAAPVAPR